MTSLCILLCYDCSFIHLDQYYLTFHLNLIYIFSFVTFLKNFLFDALFIFCFAFYTYILHCPVFTCLFLHRLNVPVSLIMLKKLSQPMDLIMVSNLYKSVYDPQQSFSYQVLVKSCSFFLFLMCILFCRQCLHFVRCTDTLGELPAQLAMAAYHTGLLDHIMGSIHSRAEF